MKGGCIINTLCIYHTRFKMKYTLYIGTNRYSLSTEDDILKLSPENFECQHKILIGNKDILRSTQIVYRNLYIEKIRKDRRSKYGK